MDARPFLVQVARILDELSFDAVLIGNAAAALQGAPVTTIDFDFYFRKTPRNLAKIKAMAKRLDAVVLRPYYPVSDLYRVVREEDGLQIDFMARIHGVRSFEGLRARALPIELDGATLRVASLDDIIKSKKAAGRPRDLAALDILERARAETAEAQPRKGTRRGGPGK